MQDNFTDICWNMKYFHNLKSMVWQHTFQDIWHGCLENILILIFWAMEFGCYFTKASTPFWLQQHNNNAATEMDAHICIAILINYCSFRDGWISLMVSLFSLSPTNWREKILSFSFETTSQPQTLICRKLGN